MVHRMISNNPVHISPATLPETPPPILPKPDPSGSTAHIQTPAQAEEETASARSIYRSNGPSAELVKRLVGQQDTRHEAAGSTSKTEAPAAAIPFRRHGESEDTGVTPEAFAASLVRQAKEICPDAAPLVIDAVIEGIAEELERLRATAEAEAGMPPAPPPPTSTSASAETPLAEAEPAHAEPETSLQLHRSQSVAASTSGDAVRAHQEISQHLTDVYLSRFQDAELGELGPVIRRNIHDAATAFVEAGCRSADAAEKMLDRFVANHRKIYTAFASLGEAGYSVLMLAFVFRIAPKLPPDLSPAAFGASAGAFVGFGMTLSGEAAGAARDRHIPKLKPTGIAAIDRLLPSLLRMAITFGVIGALCSSAKNTTRIFVPPMLGKVLNRHTIGNLDTFLDTIGSPIAAAVAANVAHRKLFAGMKQMLPFQEGFPALLRKFNEQSTIASATRTIKNDVGAYVKGLGRTAISPSTFVMAGYIAGMVAALLHLKSVITHHQPSNPGLTPAQMSQAEAAELGTLSTVMMGLLGLFAPMIAIASQYGIDRPVSAAAGRLANRWRGAPEADNQPHGEVLGEVDAEGELIALQPSAQKTPRANP